MRAITGASVYCRTEDLSVLTRNLKKVTEGDIYYISDEKNLVEKSEGVCVFRKDMRFRRMTEAIMEAGFLCPEALRALRRRSVYIVVPANPGWNIIWQIRCWL